MLVGKSVEGEGAFGAECYAVVSAAAESVSFGRDGSRDGSLSPGRDSRCSATRIGRIEWGACFATWCDPGAQASGGTDESNTRPAITSPGTRSQSDAAAGGDTHGGSAPAVSGGICSGCGALERCAEAGGRS